MGELMDVINAKGKKKPSNKDVLSDWLNKKDTDDTKKTDDKKKSEKKESK